MDDGTLTTRKRIFAASKNETNRLGCKPNIIVKFAYMKIVIINVIIVILETTIISIN